MYKCTLQRVYTVPYPRFGSLKDPISSFDFQSYSDLIFFAFESKKYFLDTL